MKSIRKRLLLLLLTSMVLVTGLALAGTYLRARDLFYEMQDYHLQQVALLLLQQGELSDAQIGALPKADVDLEFIARIWSENGALLYTSHRDYDLPQLQRAGLNTVNWDDEAFRVYVLSRHGRTVQVAQSLEVREEALRGLMLRLLLPLALLVPLLGLATWFTVGRGLRPLATLRDAVLQRHPGSLFPITLEHAPDEVKPLIGSLNDLLARLSDALEGQRRFTADAAHELRTPLTAVKLQFQLLERAGSDSERKEAVVNLEQGIERAIHLVNQLLTLARLDPENSARDHEPVMLDALLYGVYRDFTALAASRSIDLRLHRCDEVAIDGNVEQLRTLLANLVDNAIRYTPDHGIVELSALRDDSGMLVEVADSGPGIEPQERERVFDRFYRPAGTKQPGSGLGLSIARRIVEAHHVRIVLDESRYGGLLVQVLFSSFLKEGLSVHRSS